jgi:phosphatidylserine/phosphatidylglycerophosphate/cardiolipin synthase-like enzyme
MSDLCDNRLPFAMRAVELLPTGPYLLALRDDIEHPDTQRVEMQVFYFRSGAELDVFYNSLIKLLKRGGSLLLKLDAVYSGEFNSSFLHVRLKRVEENEYTDPEARETILKLRELREYGAEIQYIKPRKGIGKLLSAFGRDHRKNAVMYDKNGEIRVVYTGARNVPEMDDPCESQLPVESWRNKNDAMLRITDKELVDVVAETIKYIDESLPKKNIHIPTSLGTFYLSVGNGTSNIRKELLGIMRNASTNDEIILANQMPIDPFFAFHLRRAASRGADVIVILPNDLNDQMSGFAYKAAQWLSERITGNTGVRYMKLDDKKQFTHSKALFVRLGPDFFGFTGSENIAVIQGIWLRTTDDGLIAKNNYIAEMIRDHLYYLAGK